MTDHLTAELASLRPHTIADDGWADSHVGHTALEAVHARVASEPRSRRRPLRLWAVAAAGVAVFAGGAAAVAAISSSAPNDRHMVLCNQSASLTVDGAGVSVDEGTPAAAAAACAAKWSRIFPGTLQPARFAVCVYPASMQGGGGQVALPADADSTDQEVCAAAGTVPAN